MREQNGPSYKQIPAYLLDGQSAISLQNGLGSISSLKRVQLVI